LVPVYSCSSWNNRLRWITPLVIIVSLFAQFAFTVPSTSARELAANSAYLRDVVPDKRETIGTNVSGADQYRIEVTFDPITGSFQGRERINAFSPSSESLDAVTLFLPTNAPGSNYSAATRIQSASINAEPIDAINDKISMLGSALTLPIGGGLAPGASVNIDLQFTTRIKIDSDMYSDSGQDWTTQTWAVADWFPVVANFDEEQGWITRGIYSSYQVGGKFDYYDVTVNAPSEYQIVSSGSEISTKEKGTATAHRFIAGPARGFGLAIDTDFRIVSTTVGGTNLNVVIDTYFAGVEATALQMAASALQDYSDRYGSYPFRELDVLIEPWVSAAGIAFPGFVWIAQPFNRDSYNLAIDENELDLIDFDATISHEIGHQWWGINVSSNMVTHDFLVEGLTECMAIMHIARSYGATAANIYIRDYTAGMYLDYRNDYDDEAVDQSHNDGSSGVSPAIMYGKAPLALFAVRADIGPEAFEGAIETYTMGHAFGLTGPADLEAALERASGEDLGDIWNKWFESEDVSRSDVNDLLSDAIFKRDETV
jgi:hypothetical protein